MQIHSQQTATSSAAGSAASEAAIHKTAKYVSIASTHHFIPIAIETSGIFDNKADEFLQQVRYRCTEMTGNPNETSYLIQQRQRDRIPWYLCEGVLDSFSIYNLVCSFVLVGAKNVIIIIIIINLMVLCGVSWDSVLEPIHFILYTASVIVLLLINKESVLVSIPMTLNFIYTSKLTSAQKL